MEIKVLRNHTYALKYKGKYVINYAWREPLNKEKWVLKEDDGKYIHCCPLPDVYLKQLVGDPTVKFIDLGIIE